MSQVKVCAIIFSLGSFLKATNFDDLLCIFLPIFRPSRILFVVAAWNTRHSGNVIWNRKFDAKKQRQNICLT